MKTHQSFLFMPAIIVASAVMFSGCFSGGSVSKAGTAPAASVTITESDYLIDVRSADEYAEGHLKGARLIPHTEIAEKIAGLTTDKAAAIYVYCRSGRRSGIARETLEKLGYTRVVNLGSKEEAAERTALPVVTD